MRRAALLRLPAGLALGLLLAAPAAAGSGASGGDAVLSARVAEAVWQQLFGSSVIREARGQLGQPYLWGGKSGRGGFDCSGYTAWVYRRLGVGLKPSTVGQILQGRPVPRAQLQAGDLVFFLGQGSPYHVGIYEGAGRFLHAPGAGKRIQSSRLDSPYFARRYLGARRPSLSLQAERLRRARPGLTVHPSQESRT